MKLNVKGLRFVFFPMLVLVSISLSSCAAQVTKAAPQTLTGIVTDIHCYLKKPDITLDTKKCLEMDACSSTGYGVVVFQPDKTSQFYFLDGNFAPAAMGAQNTVAQLIRASTRTDHFYFTVTGTVDSKEKITAYDKEYPVITVSSIVESNGE